MTTARRGTSDPVEHMLHLPSSWPVAQPPSPRFAQRRSLPSPPDPLPTQSENAPTGSLSRSAPYTLQSPLRLPPLSHPRSLPLALRSARGCIYLSDTPPPSRSTLPTTVAARSLQPARFHRSLRPRS